MYMLPLFLGDVAGSEILVILIVILLFFGSKSIPGIAKTMGKAMYQIRNASSELQNEIKKSGAGIKEDLNIESLIKESQDQLVQPLDQMYSDVENSVHYTGRPQTPIEKANQLEEVQADEAQAIIETQEPEEQKPEAQASINTEETIIEPNKPIE
ncbi:MAG: twin-arginine translocase TatA/TatE family subunit [Crocinitomicaceae bacterium]|jgi:TatA/E family protein of Tat protein translocase|nr:twin-arginine translocase TatA/TatE family subunit [Crocinitomicaceae bacterium]